MDERERFLALWQCVVAVVIFALGPLASIWALNTLFHTAIPCTSRTWLAIVWLGFVWRMTFKSALDASRH